jgi:hypothetical protein
MRMKIAVIGAGIFGISVALRLNKAGYEVDLIEKNSDILQAASGINQYRLHRGYHYPRSLETSQSASAAEARFRAEYGAAVIDHNTHYYGIAREGSKVTAREFEDFCRACDLEFERTHLPLLNEKEFQLIVKVREALFDPGALYDICTEKLRDSSVRLMCDTYADHTILPQYDRVINCTYANLNSVLHPEKHTKKEYQFELCEKPIFKFPAEYDRASIVVLDGPFMCIDPLGSTGLHVMGNVVHALHHTGTGHHLDIPAEYLLVVNKGVIPAREIQHISRINHFVESASRYIPGAARAKHIGSMFTIRTVLPHVDHTDARPTLVEQVDNTLITVFSGKIGNSVIAAEEVLQLIQKSVSQKKIQKSTIRKKVRKPTKKPSRRVSKRLQRRK